MFWHEPLLFQTMARPKTLGALNVDVIKPSTNLFLPAWLTDLLIPLKMSSKKPRVVCFLSSKIKTKQLLEASAYRDLGPGTGFSIPGLLRHIHFQVRVGGVQPSCLFPLLLLRQELQWGQWDCIIFKGKGSHSGWDLNVTLVSGFFPD